jgi:chromosome segregation ATPase
MNKILEKYKFDNDKLNKSNYQLGEDIINLNKSIKEHDFTIAEFNDKIYKYKSEIGQFNNDIKIKEDKITALEKILEETKNNILNENNLLEKY